MGAGLDLTGRRKDGSEFPIDISLSFMQADGGLLYLSAVRDVTDRRRAQEVLVESETRYRDLFEEAPIAYWSVHSDGSIQSANRQAAKMFGYTVEELIGRPVFDLYADTPAGKERAQELFQRFKAGHEIRNVEIEYRSADGRHVWGSISVRPILDFGGTVVESRSIVVDITERKSREEKLNLTSLRLDETLAELRLAQAQLVQQERLRALGEMAAGIAHDFNNQLTGVLGFTELLLYRPENLDDKERLIQGLQSINAAARDAAEVVRRLREFYRPIDDDDSFALNDLRLLAERVVSFTRPKCRQQAQSRGVDVSLQTELQEVPLISGNESELREVLTNLIFNAVDAMESSGTITVCVYREGDNAVLMVKDTGKGMTEEVRQRCMKPFFSTKGEGGSGLGLSLAYGIIQRHHGTIEIESEIGKGTTIFILLPVALGQHGRPIGAKASSNKRALRVLAVDDEPLSRQVVAEYLAADGHSVETAASGQEALKKLQAGEFDVVVTDRAMPEMNGEQLAALIKEKTPRTPVILLTGFTDNNLVEDEKLGNVTVILSKPVTLAALRAALAKVTGDGGTRA